MPCEVLRVLIIIIYLFVFLIIIYLFCSLNL